MYFATIHGDPEKYKYFSGLYSKQFDALFAFLGTQIQKQLNSYS